MSAGAGVKGITDKNKRSMNLENEILQLCFDVLKKELTPLEAQKEILRLLDVLKSLPQDTNGCGNDRETCSCKNWGGCPLD